MKRLLERWTRRQTLRNTARPTRSYRHRVFTLEPLEPRVLLSAVPAEVAAPPQQAAVEPAAVTVPAGPLPSLDVDLNGQADALTDGIVILRHLFGFTGAALTDGAVDPLGQRTDPTAIQNYLNSISSSLDVDLNQSADALSDGIVIIRNLFGFTGSALTDGAVDPGGQRTDPAAITAALDNMNPERERLGPLITVGLQQDTGVSATDGITFDPTINGAIADLNQITTFVATLEKLPPASTPRFRVTNMTDGEIVPSGVLPIEFAADNFVLDDFGGAHLHFYIDADPTPYEFFNGSTQEVQYNGAHTHFVHWRSPTSIELHSPSPGAHRVRFVLTDAGERELANPEATATVSFTVAAPAPGIVTLEPVYRDVLAPVSLAFAPDGRLFYSELTTGRIRVITAEGQLLEEPFHQFDVISQGDQGLFGLALDPEFSSNGYLYAYYTHQDPDTAVVSNRIARVTDSNGAGIDPQIIRANLPVGSIHNGGILAIGLDRTLYATVGENNIPDQAQDLTSEAGKVLRLNLDGSTPADNPFPGSAVYAYGLRNPFGLTIHGETGDVWLTDNGPEYGDEVNRIVAGGNYGWPAVSGAAGNPAYLDPLVSIAHPIAPTAILDVRANSRYSQEYDGNLLFTDFNTGQIYLVVLGGPARRDLDSFSVLHTGGQGPLFDLKQSPDGWIYASGPDTIYRLVVTPPVALQLADVSAAPSDADRATIMWTTNLAAGGQVEYGTTSAYGQASPLESSATVHRVVLTGLQPGTTYHYRVRSQTAQEQVTSADLTFTTPAVILPGGVDVLSTLQPDGTFAFDAAQLEQLFGGPLAQGSYLVRLRSSDARGTVSPVVMLPFTLDTVAPVIAQGGLSPSSDTPPVGDQQTTMALVTIIGQAEPQAFVTLLETGDASVAAADGTFQFLDVPLAIGANSVTLRAIDAAGNVDQVVHTIMRLAEDAGSPQEEDLFAPLFLPSEIVELDPVATGTVPPSPADSLTGLDRLRRHPRFQQLDGDGMTAVVIDSGIDPDHPFFGPDRDRNGIADRIIFQYDFADNDADASDRMGHGSHIASVIASEDPLYPGVAPAADLIALKVFRDSGAGTFGYVEEALQWVIAHAEEYGIDVVNLSLGDGRNWTAPGGQYGIGDEFAALADAGVLLIAAAGNNFFTARSLPGVAYPAADPNVIGVGAVWTADFGGPWRWSSGAIDFTTGPDRIASFSQRDPLMTELFAPGARLVGANHLGGTVTMQGTSQAAAYLSGTALLAQQYAEQRMDRKLSADEFVSVARRGSRPLVDGDDEDTNVASTGETFARIDVSGLAKSLRRYAVLERSGLGDIAGRRDLALAFIQRCWVTDFVGGGAVDRQKEELSFELS